MSDTIFRPPHIGEPLTQVRVESGEGHDCVTIWIRHQNCGDLVMDKGTGIAFVQRFFTVPHGLIEQQEPDEAQRVYDRVVKAMCGFCDKYNDVRHEEGQWGHVYGTKGYICPAGPIHALRAQEEKR